MTKRISFLSTIFLLLLFLSSCTDPASNYKAITGSIENLPQLSGNYEYAAWLIESGNTRLMGTIEPDADGSDLFSFVPVPDNIRDASSVLITIEDGSSNYSSPSETQVLVSNFGSSDQVDLVASVIGGDFSNITGTYILDSPTTTSSSTDNSGIWFVDENITQGLNLPVLQSGWMYEGWVIFNNTPVSTGKFSDPGGADDLNKYSGNETPYDFPGEDFNNPSEAPAGVNFPTDLKGKTVKITLEPFPDDSANPYPMAIMTDSVPNPSITKTNIELNSGSDNLPYGTVTKEKE